MDDQKEAEGKSENIPGMAETNPTPQSSALCKLSVAKSV